MDRDKFLRQAMAVDFQANMAEFNEWRRRKAFAESSETNFLWQN